MTDNWASLTDTRRSSVHLSGAMWLQQRAREVCRQGSPWGRSWPTTCHRSSINPRSVQRFAGSIVVDGYVSALQVVFAITAAAFGIAMLIGPSAGSRKLDEEAIEKAGGGAA